MKIIRFQSGKETLVGTPIDERTAHRIEGDILGDYRVTQQTAKMDKLLSPIVPTDILCIGLNYREHAAESGSPIPKNPMLFIKASGTLNHPGGNIQVPRLSSEVDFEAELCIVIGKTAKDVTKEKAFDHILGYTCANDVSARDWQRNKDLGGGQFCRGKSFDGFCPIGPWIVTKDEIPNPNALGIKSMLNGQVMQNLTTGDMIFDIPTLIQSLSSTLTLRPGCVILTGTPQGVGFARTPPVFMKAGDKIVVEIEKIGRLENSLVASD